MRLTDEEVADRLAALPHWHRDGDSIVRDFDCGDFNGSIAFVNAIARAANEHNHHPDIAIAWNHVVVRVSSHDVRAITERDVALALIINALL
jgi:4a-hydroxytetrahydrobiopterin dehydratase